MLAPPLIDPRAGANAAAATAPTGAMKSLRDVWIKGLYGKAPEIADLDLSQIGQFDPSTGTTTALKLIPERFANGRVQRPHIEVVQVPAEPHEPAQLMHPKARRTLHDAEVIGHEAKLAVRDAFRAKTKLAKTCAINYPNGALGCVEAPGTNLGEASVYEGIGEDLARQYRAANRKAKGVGEQHTSVMGNVLSGQGEVAEARRGGVRTFNKKCEETISMT